jgi:hypothetical protein
VVKFEGREVRRIGFDDLVCLLYLLRRGDGRRYIRKRLLLGKNNLVMFRNLLHCIPRVLPSTKKQENTHVGRCS